MMTTPMCGPTSTPTLRPNQSMWSPAPMTSLLPMLLLTLKGREIAKDVQGLLEASCGIALSGNRRSLETGFGGFEAVGLCPYARKLDLKN